MNGLDLIFGGVKNRKSVHEALIEGGFLSSSNVNEFSRVVESPEFQGIIRLLIVLSDRKGRGEERAEDSYAAFSKDLSLFLDGCNKYLDKKAKKEA